MLADAYEVWKMKSRLLLLIATVALITVGCATKGYVAKSQEPMRQTIDELSAKTGKHDEQIQQANEEISKNRTEIGVTKESANLANTRAGEADGKATAAGQASAKNSQDIEALRQVVANIDDYKVASEVSVQFGFDRDALTKEAQEQLDQLATQKPANGGRYFLAIEGFTDHIGPADYNFALSKRRSERVVQYLVAKHNFPIYRIYNVGLGKEKPAVDGKDAASRAKNRRVELRMYTADASSAVATSAQN